MSAAQHLEQSEQLGLFAEPPEPRPVIEQRRYSNGAMHFYEVDHRGKHRHIGYKEILAAHGHAGDTQGRPPVETEGPSLFDMPEDPQLGRRDDSDVVEWNAAEMVQALLAYRSALAPQRTGEGAQSDLPTEEEEPAEFTLDERWRLSQLLGIVPTIRGEFVAKDGRQLTPGELAVILAREQQIQEGVRQRQPEPTPIPLVVMPQLRGGKHAADFNQPVKSMDRATRVAFFANFNRTDDKLRPPKPETEVHHRKPASHAAALAGGLAVLGFSPAGKHETQPLAEKTEVAKQERTKKRRRLAAGVVVGALVVGAVFWGLEQLTDDDHHEGTAPGQHQTTQPQTVKPGQQVSPKQQNHNHQRGHTPGFVAGFAVQSQVAPGDGYTQKLQGLAAQKHITLSPSESYRAYRFVNRDVHGKFFTDDPSYKMANGDYGISRAGSARWVPRALIDFRHWLETNGKTST